MDNKQNDQQSSGKRSWQKVDWAKLSQGYLNARKVVQTIFSKVRILVQRLRETTKIKEDIGKAFGHLHLRRIVALVVLVLFVLYLSSGSYLVSPGEEAVERLFGRVVAEGISEGLHYRLPWPFQQVDKVNVSEIKREGIGLLLQEHRGVHSSPEKIQILTGDENIIEVQLVIQYRISDPAKYLFKVDYRPYQIINEVVRYAITRIGSSMLVDEMLTIAKEEIQRRVQSETQRLLDAYQSGLSVVTVNIKKMYPPDEVSDSFRDVASAREDKSRIINNAQGYRNSLLPPAKGEAVRKIRKAEGYHAEVINRAQGETDRFLQMLAEYRKTSKNASTDVTRERLYIETMEKIFPKVKKYILDTEDGGKVNLRFFGEE
ncbi:MAG: FtsH protease activity modulator HflK [Planctomycetia bacterium]|nr:FtsH protease activity modulator HflK [Planctomycetia bacterium]